MMRRDYLVTGRDGVALLASLWLLVNGCTGQTGAFSPSAPGDEEDLWAVRCITLYGPNRFKLAQSYETALRNVRGLKADLVQVFHEGETSTVYYGKYRRRPDAGPDRGAYTPDPLPDLRLIRQLAVGNRDIWPFRLAVLDALPTASVGRPEWDLSNADGYWSLQVAVFYNTPGMQQRKHAAVEYCMLLREQQEGAYYHHGPVNSSVCIGTFPKSAIAEIRSEDPYTGVLRFTSRIVDERMLALQKKHPFNLENGHKVFQVEHDPVTGKKERIPNHSFPVKLPRAAQAESGSLGE
ncbi:MAG: hypothetical protein KKB50_06880 [Planctomycetes bacterium]|nr:hypothetical protein [Planctomycetota bacterium]